MAQSAPSEILLGEACGVPVGRRSGGRLAMMLVATMNIIIFFSPSQPFLIQGVLGSKENYFAKVKASAQKPGGTHLSRPRRPFWGPLVAILDFAGCVALQVVSECPRRS